MPFTIFIKLLKFFIDTEEPLVFALQLSWQNCSIDIDVLYILWYLFRPKDSIVDLSIDTGAPKRRVCQNSFVLLRDVICVT